MIFGRSRDQLPAADAALKGRDTRPFAVGDTHAVLGTPIEGDAPDGLEVAVFGMGCFWGSEELYWQTPGVHSTAAGYAGGYTANPTYEEVCSGQTGHAEVVRVVYDPAKVSYLQLLKVFWENHDPTQGMRQGNDLGTQYRSVILTTSDEQARVAGEAKERYGKELADRGLGEITTQIEPLGDFWYAEDHHQQYLHKVPNGYRCHAKSDVPFPVGA